MGAVEDFEPDLLMLTVNKVCSAGVASSSLMRKLCRIMALLAAKAPADVAVVGVPAFVSWPFTVVAVAVFAFPAAAVVARPLLRLAVADIVLVVLLLVVVLPPSSYSVVVAAADVAVPIFVVAGPMLGFPVPLTSRLCPCICVRCS